VRAHWNAVILHLLNRIGAWMTSSTLTLEISLSQLEGMTGIQRAKAEADAHYKQKLFEAAVAGYDKAVELSEQQQQPDLLHLLYSNR
jgi:hypothetical protein